MGRIPHVAAAVIAAALISTSMLAAPASGQDGPGDRRFDRRDGDGGFGRRGRMGREGRGLRGRRGGFRDPGPVETLRTARGSSIAFIHLAPKRRGADALILLAGGAGRLGLSGGRLRLGNFLVRMRQSFADAGFRVIVPDTPDDHPEGLAGQRITAWHGADILRLAAWARRQGARRVWLVGTSRGTVGAVNAASVPGARVDGLVLTSSLMVRSRRYAGTVFDLPLARIRMPVLIVHHRDDACRQTPPGLVPRLAAALTNARPITVRMLSGGAALRERGWRRPRNPECRAWSHHGFLDIERRAVSVITGWLASR